MSHQGASLGCMKRSNRLLPILILFNAFLTPAIADEVQIPSKPIATEQDDRDRLVYSILRNPLQAKIQLAITLASNSGTVTTLETSSVTEIIGLIDRQTSFLNKSEIYFQAQMDIYSKCAIDVTLATAELKKCRDNFSIYSSHTLWTKVTQRKLLEDKQYFTSAQEKINSAAANFWKAVSDKAAATKKTTITCTKGKLTKKVTAVKPKCPAGYKVKK
jgi:hypothetical protein